MVQIKLVTKGHFNPKDHTVMAKNLKNQQPSVFLETLHKLLSE